MNDDDIEAVRKALFDMLSVGKGIVKITDQGIEYIDVLETENLDE